MPSRTESDHESSDHENDIACFVRSAALAIFGTAMAFVAALCMLFAIDQWPVYHRLVLPTTDLLDAPLLVTAALFLASLTTAIVPLLAMGLLKLLHRETLGGYMLTCFLLPLPAMLIPTSEGIPLLLSVAGLVSGMFWWFAYRKTAVQTDRKARGVKLAWLSLASAAVLVVGTTVHAHRDVQQKQAEREAPVTGPQVWGGVALGPDVVLFDSDGHLMVRKRADWAPRDVFLDGVIDVKASDHTSAYVLSASPLPKDFHSRDKVPAGSFTVSRYRSGKIESLAQVAYGEGERPGVMALRKGTPLVVSDHAIQMLEPGTERWHRLALSLPEGKGLLGGDPTVAVAQDGRTMFVGLNKGEWGGGMVAVDLANGRTRPIEARRSAALCAGPLNSDCDPVTGVVPDPDHAQCVLASLGLSHMLMEGRILRVCPDRVDVVFERPLESASDYSVRQIMGLAKPPRRMPSQTEPFFALVDGEEGSLWAVSPYALYRRETAGWSRHPMPDMTRRGDLNIAEGLNGILLLSTWRNARFSLSGATPVAIPVK